MREIAARGWLGPAGLATLGALGARNGPHRGGSAVGTGVAVAEDMRRGLSGIAVLATLGGVACEENASPVASASSPVALESVPEKLQPQVNAARAAMKDLGRTLLARLDKALVDKGPRAAIDVCASAAQPLTREVAEKHGIELGRTSHKLRNPKNAPRPWVKPWLQANAGKRVEAVKGAVYDLGNRLGVVEPIGTKGVCVTCHGTSVDPDLERAIRDKYPKDRATGFEIGELRGAFWAEVPKQ